MTHFYHKPYLTTSFTFVVPMQSNTAKERILTLFTNKIKCQIPMKHLSHQTEYGIFQRYRNAIDAFKHRNQMRHYL